jgi:thymidylate synthase
MNTLDLQYQNLIHEILNNGVIKSDRTGAGTKSIFGATIRHSMADGKFPLLTTKKMHWPSIVTELLWFLRGDTNIKYLVDNGCNIWNGDCYKAYLLQCAHTIEDNIDPPTEAEFIAQIKASDDFAKQWGDLGPIYGKQWRGSKNPGSLDQIVQLICDIVRIPDSRRLLVNAYNVNEVEEMVLPPCHYAFQIYTRDLTVNERIALFNKKWDSLNDVSDDVSENTLYLNNIPTKAISLLWTQRSCDVFLGLPFNIASYGLLLNIIADTVNMVPDELIGNLGDTHLYLNHIDQANEQITRYPYELPTVSFLNTFIDDADRKAMNRVYDKWEKDAVTRTLNNMFNNLSLADFKLSAYNSHPAIKAPLNN